MQLQSWKRQLLSPYSREKIELYSTRCVEQASMWDVAATGGGLLCYATALAF